MCRVIIEFNFSRIKQFTIMGTAAEQWNKMFHRIKWKEYNEPESKTENEIQNSKKKWLNVYMDG